MRFTSVASLGWVSHGAAHGGVTPIFSWRPFISHRRRRLPVTPIYFLLINGRPFLLITVIFIDFTRGVTPHWRVSLF